MLLMLLMLGGHACLKQLPTWWVRCGFLDFRWLLMLGLCNADCRIPDLVTRSLSQFTMNVLAASCAFSAVKPASSMAYMRSASKPLQCAMFFWGVEMLFGSGLFEQGDRRPWLMAHG